jgi:hypothetical protein
MPSQGEQPELSDFLARSSKRMKPFHQSSDQEKREVADELMMQPSSFGVLFIAAALLLIVLLWSPIPELIASAAAIAHNTVVSSLH